jgi:hypothetical protein
MPTGYTYGIEDGTITTFPAFAVLCARAFGATITMRDEPLDAPIPDEFQPSEYHAKALERARERLAEVRVLPVEDAEARALAEYDAAVISHRAYEEEQAVKAARYAAMRAKVAAWTPPTPEHTGVKTFMLEQIDISVSTYVSPAPVRRTGAEWIADEIETAMRDIAYHTKHDAEERERAASRTAWVRALRDSLGGGPPPEVPMGSEDMPRT